MTDNPEWVDAGLSKELPVLRARGEGQELEYMESFPTNTHELAKEIAAFASTNPGTILIGVSDDGSLVGLQDATDPQQRDQYLRRLEGICRGTIKPAITPRAIFALEAGAVVLCLSVPKGSEPVYYSRNIPYVRHLSASRPADPHEVIDRVQRWLAFSIEQDDDERSQFHTRLASALIDVLIYDDEIDERIVNPWLDLWRTQFAQSAAELRDLAAMETATEDELDNKLRDVADKLDKAAHFQLYLGCGPKFKPLIRDALDAGHTLKQETIDEIALTERSVSDALKTIYYQRSALADLVSRMDDMASEGRIEEVQSEASQVGGTLLRVGHYPIPTLREEQLGRLREIGHQLHLVETARLLLDGGRSIKDLLDRIRETSGRLDQFVEALGQDS